MKRYNLSNKKNGFTLTEILIALAVIAIIIAICIPFIISKTTNKTFSTAYNSQMTEILNSMEELTINENLRTFNDTIMNIKAPHNSTEAQINTLIRDTEQNRADEYLKKYMRMVKFCNNQSGDCFARNYAQYNNNQRTAFDLAEIVSGAKKYQKGAINDDYSGMACGLMKNGISLCISPRVTDAQTGAELRPIRGFIDLNGPKEPNVLGRDLRSFSLDIASRHIASAEAAIDIVPPLLSLRNRNKTVLRNMIMANMHCNLMMIAVPDL